MILLSFPLGENDLRVQTLYSGNEPRYRNERLSKPSASVFKINDPETWLLLPAEGQQAWTYPVRSCDRYVGAWLFQCR